MKQDSRTLIQSNLPCKWCPSHDAMCEYTDNFFCFSCNGYEHKTKRARRRTNPVMSKREVLDGVVRLPDSATKDLPAPALAWLYKRYFTKALINKYTILWAAEFVAWSNKLSNYIDLGPRLIFTNYTESRLVSYDARSLDPKQAPKYLSYGNRQALFWSVAPKVSSILVIVEDSLSAMRVGEIAPAVALRGTIVDESMITEITKKEQYTKYIVWMDKDRPGRKATRKLVTKLKWFNPVVEIFTVEDPKFLSVKAITEILWRNT